MSDFIKMTQSRTRGDIRVRAGEIVSVWQEGGITLVETKTRTEQRLMFSVMETPDHIIGMVEDAFARNSPTREPSDTEIAIVLQNHRATLTRDLDVDAAIAQVRNLFKGSH